MPDVVVFARPDVTIAAAVPATVPHARLHNLTNAVQVAAESADLGRVNITVGLGINTNVTLGVQTTVAGVGNSTTLRAGDAVGGGPSNGGDITIQPGVGVGGGTAGQFLPYATAVVNLGSTSRVWGTTFTRGVRPDSGQNLDIRTIQTGAGAGPDINVLGAAGSAGAFTGGAINLTAGAGGAGGANAGGAIALLTGAGGAGGTGAGGALTLTVGNSTGGATAGSALTCVAGSAEGGGAGVAGNIVLTPGLAGNGTTRGAITTDAATNTVTLGTATVAWSTTFTRALRPDDDASLAISTVRNASASALSITLTAAAAATTAVPGAITLTAGGSDAVTGGAITLNAGDASAAVGGAINLNAGDGGGVSNGGAVTLTGGALGINPGAQVVVGGAPSGAAGALSLLGGQATSGNGGAVTLTAGRSDGGGVGGNVTITTGQAANGVTGTLAMSTPNPDGGANAAGPITITVGNSSGATAGSTLTLTTGAAGAASGLNGGDVIISPGAGDGAGTRGVIRAGTGTGTVSLGTGSIAWLRVATREVRADTGQNLNVLRADGAVWLTLSSGNRADISASVPTRIADNGDLEFGGGSDFRHRWGTANANNAMVWATGVNSAAQSGNVIFTTSANIANEHGLAAVATPRLAIFSAADMSVAGNRTQYIQMYHDGTNGTITTGALFLNIGGGSQGIQLRSGATNLMVLSGNTGGGTLCTITQAANSSGSPIALLVTGGAHTTLAAGVESLDLNFNLARTVQFATGALALQRAVLVQAPTYGFVGASTLTTTATFVVTAAPTAGTNATFTNPICAQFGGAVTVGPTAAAFAYRVIDVPAHTVTVTGSTQVTAASGAAAVRLDVITLSGASAVTVDRAGTLHIVGPPVGGGAGPVTITTAWAIQIDDGSIGSGDGTAARPSYAFRNDPNTGIYSVGADTIGFATGGDSVPRFQIDTNETAGETALLLSVAGLAVSRVSVGANDSGGAGFRLVRIPNA